MKNEVFDKYLNRLRIEGFLRALLCGLAVAFGGLLVTAFICWFVGFKGIWLSAVIFVVATATAAPLFYHFIFSPTTKSMARRIDELGLEERILTMTQLEGDNSYIATVQRADAMSALGKLNASMIKLVVSIPVIILCAAIGLGAAGMTTVHALNVAGVIPSGIELAIGNNDDEYTITYKIGGEGVVHGVNVDKDKDAEEAQPEDTQAKTAFTAMADGTQLPEEENKEPDEPGFMLGGLLAALEEKETAIGTGLSKQEGYIKVKPGESTETVIAVPADGYVFIGWSDGVKSPIRSADSVYSDKTITALFQPVDGKSNLEELSDNVTLYLKNGDKNGNGGEPQPGDKSDPEPGDGDNNPGAGAGNDPSNQYKDGKKYYGESYGSDREDGLDYINNSDVSDSAKDATNRYYDSIATKGDGN